MILGAISLLLCTLIIAPWIDKATELLQNKAAPEPNGRTVVRRTTAAEKIINAIIRLGLLVYLEVFISSLINLKADTSQSNDRFAFASKVTSIAMLILVVGQILLWTWFSVKFYCDEEPSREIKSTY